MSIFPDPPKNAHGGIWKDAEGNVDWDAYADEASEAKTITAEKLQEIRQRTVHSMNYGSTLDALNAISDYTSAREAWHRENSAPGDPPIWEDPWREP